MIHSLFKINNSDRFSHVFQKNSHTRILYININQSLDLPKKKKNPPNFERLRANCLGTPMHTTVSALYFQLARSLSLSLQSTRRVDLSRNKPVEQKRAKKGKKEATNAVVEKSNPPRVAYTHTTYTKNSQ